MDEETLRKEFEERFSELPNRLWFDKAIRETAWIAWLESARRAERVAWKKCAETLESNQSCSPAYIAVLIRKELAKPEE